MPSYTVQDFRRIKPEIEETSISEYITDRIADNYCKGLNGKYFDRLSKGIQVATQATAEQLITISKQLIADRVANGAETRFNSSQLDGLSDGQKRALILALWSSRIPFINSIGKIDIELRAVYKNENYMPPVDLSMTPRLIKNNPHEDQSHEPTLEEFEVFLRSFSRNREISIDDAFDAFKQQYTEKGRTLKSGWQERLEEKLTQSERT